MKKKVVQWLAPALLLGNAWLANAANERLRVAMRDIKAQRTGAVSLMPEGLQAGLSRAHQRSISGPQVSDMRCSHNPISQ